MKAYLGPCRMSSQENEKGFIGKKYKLIALHDFYFYFETKPIKEIFCAGEYRLDEQEESDYYSIWKVGEQEKKTIIPKCVIERFKESSSMRFIEVMSL